MDLIQERVKEISVIRAVSNTNKKKDDYTNQLNKKST